MGYKSIKNANRTFGKGFSIRQRLVDGGGFSIELRVPAHKWSNSKTSSDTIFNIPCEELVY